MSAIPPGARWLGFAGLAPFLALTFVILSGSVDVVENANFALRAYGAVILSFLGGIQWGLAIRSSDGNARSRQGLTPMLALSVVPSLIGWAGLLMPERLGFFVLITGFALVLAADLRAVRRSMAPDWYPRLRYPLTGVVISCLVATVAYLP